LSSEAKYKPDTILVHTNWRDSTVAPEFQAALRSEEIQHSGSADMRAMPRFVFVEAKYRLQGTGFLSGLISSTVPNSAFIGYL
jgi:hypothetical protein